MSKSWRPLSWNTEIIAQENMPMFKWGTEEYAQMIRGIEAGADAMLGMLKKQGSYLNGDTVIPAQGKFPEIHCPGGMIGWLVFIPDEEAD